MRRAALGSLFLSVLASVATAAPPAPPPAPGAPGTKLTFHGLRQLEDDPKVPDEEKVREWEAFVVRAAEQAAYARAAAARWRGAARARIVEAARAADRDDAVPPDAKLERWAEVARAHPKGPEAREARARTQYWQKAELRRLVEAAEEVERGGKPKPERIHAWAEVVGWGARTPEARRASSRIAALAGQLLEEARSVDRIERVDAATKIAAWRDVLAGMPSPKARALAEARIAALERR